MNIVLGIISIILCFSSIIVLDKLFKKDGLIVWVSVATIIANIIVCKTINLLGFVSSLGNIMFASNFLATDILTEKYGSKEARKSVILGILSAIVFLVATQITLLYIPDESDICHDSMKTLFSINLRTTISSLVMYAISNFADIWVFEKIKKKFPNKLWLRNNVATIVSNCLENYFFVFFAFIGIFDIPTILSIATTTSVIEIIIAIMDTPFIYLAKEIK